MRRDNKKCWSYFLLSLLTDLVLKNINKFQALFCTLFVESSMRFNCTYLPTYHLNVCLPVLLQQLYQRMITFSTKCARPAWAITVRWKEAKPGFTLKVNTLQNRANEMLQRFLLSSIWYPVMRASLENATYCTHLVLGVFLLLFFCQANTCSFWGTRE